MYYIDLGYRFKFVCEYMCMLQLFAQVSVNEGDIVKLKWTPCTADEAGAKKMTWTDIESSDDLLEQPVTMVTTSI